MGERVDGHHNDGMWNLFVARFVWPGFVGAVSCAITQFVAMQQLKDRVRDNTADIKVVSEVTLPRVERDLEKETIERKQSDVDARSLFETRMKYLLEVLESNSKAQAAQTEQISQVIGLFRMQNQIK